MKFVADIILCTFHPASTVPVKKSIISVKNQIIPVIVFPVCRMSFRFWKGSRFVRHERWAFCLALVPQTGMVNIYGAKLQTVSFAAYHNMWVFLAVLLEIERDW